MADLPACKYGKKCYRKSADHFRRFSHGDAENNQDSRNTSEPPTKRRRKNEDQEETTSDLGKEGRKSDKISNAIIKDKFGINMPQDFYDLWEFCEELNPQSPRGVVSKYIVAIIRHNATNLYVDRFSSF